MGFLEKKAYLVHQALGYLPLSKYLQIITFQMNDCLSRAEREDSDPLGLKVKKVIKADMDSMAYLVGQV